LGPIGKGWLGPHPGPKRIPPRHGGMGGGILQYRTRLGGIGGMGDRVRSVNPTGAKTFRPNLKERPNASCAEFVAVAE
jgi:hypothetical protein